jgi:glycerol-3-phosphate dehydrogenase
MYDRGELDSDQGLKDLKAFLSSRWRGMRPMLWDTALIQEELQEAVHCGIFGLEL